jgi:hypothetical protein
MGTLRAAQELQAWQSPARLLGVHINSIKGKDGLVKAAGPNPLRYIGVTYSQDGKEATLWEVIGSDWVKYDKIDGSASYAVNVPEQYRGKGFNLSNWYPAYDWVANDGYNNFAKWII